MSHGETAAATEADGLAEQVVLDVSRPLRVTHLTPAARRLTLAVVSIGWLRGRSPEALASLRERYLTPAETEQAAALRAPAAGTSGWPAGSRSNTPSARTADGTGTWSGSPAPSRCAPWSGASRPAGRWWTRRSRWV